MKILVTSIVDKNYLQMAKLFCRSLIEKSSVPISSIIVGSLDLDEGEKSALRAMSDIVEVVDLTEGQTSEQVHDEAWLNNVSLKTRFVRKLFRDHEFDLLLLADADQIVLHDPVDLFQAFGEVNLVRRARPAVRPEFRLDYIASNVVFRKGDVASDFLDDWIDSLQAVARIDMEPPFETLALNLTARQYSRSGDIFDLQENIVSCENDYVDQETKIIHLKSNGRTPLGNLFGGRFGLLASETQSKILTEVPYARDYM